jgi:hypothetical protein
MRALEIQSIDIGNVRMICPEFYAHHPVGSVSRDEANSLSPY